MKFEQALKSYASSISKNLSAEKNQGYRALINNILAFYQNSDENNRHHTPPFNHPLLQGKDFKFIRSGSHGFIIGNDKIVVKVGEDYRSYSGEDSLGMAPSIAPSEIPAGLAAEILPDGEGQFGGVPYLICQRRHTKNRAQLEEIISHLYAGRKQGVVYLDAHSDNYGRPAPKGNIEVIDHAHFKKFTPEIFAAAVSEAIKTTYKHRKYPLVFADDKNTYVLLSNHPKSVSPDVEQRVRMILGNAGIQSDMELTAGMLMAIPETKISYGHPPRERPLSGYLADSLKAPGKGGFVKAIGDKVSGWVRD